MSSPVTDPIRQRIAWNSESMHTETVWLPGDRGDEIEAYLARPNHDKIRPGVVLIHHMPGYDRGTKEMARRFAEMGYDTICPNLYWREAPGAAPDDAAASARRNGGVPDEQVLGDLHGCILYLRSLETSNRKVGVIGHCSGGRQAVLAGCTLPVDAVVDCYGGSVTGRPPPGRAVSNLVDRLPTLACPLLGLFGNQDARPSPEQVDELEAILTVKEKTYEFHRYDDAGHAFFATDRPSYRVAAANDGWKRVESFFRTQLGADGAAFS